MSSPSHEQRIEERPERGGDRLTVLVVDDEASLLRGVTRILMRSGYGVLQASDGVSALEVAADHPHEIDLLLTDVVMPRMGGRELREEFARRYPGVPVLVMSAYTEDTMLREGIRTSEVEFVAKPFTGSELLQRVRDLTRGTA